MNISMLSSIAAKKRAPWYEWLLILIIAAVFGYAGVIKLCKIASFSHVIARFDVLPTGLINPGAIILPSVEILLAVALLFPSLQRPALLGTLLCCVVFGVVLLSAIMRGIPVSCGCFGITEKPSFHATLLALGRDAVLLGLSLSLYLRRVRSYVEN